MPTRPDFFIIGAPKAGSTSLWASLRHHPDVFTPELKEPNFFCDNGGRYPDWDWYDAHFEEAPAQAVVGEASVAYSLVERNPNTPTRIFENVPDARLLYIVRHPLDRMESAWKHHLYNQNPVPSDFSDAVLEFRPLLEGSLYMRNLSAYRQHYLDDRMKVVFLDEFSASPDAVLASCFSFLGVDPARAEDPAETQNRTKGKSVLPAPVDWLREHGLTYITQWLPAAAKQPVKQWLERPLPDTATWTRAAHRRALDVLEEDTQALLDYTGKPPDYWDLSFSARHATNETG
jgi:hypothetical protein